MKAILLLYAMLGQCSGGSCVSPSICMPFQLQAIQPAYVRPIQIQPAHAIAAPMLARYRITHDGLSFEVEGWQIPANGGNITWEPDRPFNAKSLADARAAQARRPQPAPVAPPRAPTAPTILNPRPETGQIRNFGLRPDKLGGSDSYTAPSAEAKKFIEEASRPVLAGSQKYHVTVIGTEDEQARVIGDIGKNPAFDSIRDLLLVQGYKPGEWAIDPALKFPGDGKPSILVQMAKGPADPKGGRVVLKERDYSIGPEGLAEAIRKADPNYRPDADPNSSGPKSSCPLGFNRDHWPIVAIVAAALYLIAIKLPRKEG